MNSKSIKQWYDQLYDKKFISQTTLDYGSLQICRKILAYLHPISQGAFLDVACGNGRFLHFVSSQTDLPTYGLDISNAVHKAKNLSNAQFLMASGQNIPFIAHSFHYVTILGSLEHFLHPEQGLKEIHRVATDNARICVLVPNKHYLFGAGTTQPHELLLSLSKWKRMIETCNFKVEAVLQDNHPKYQINVFEDKNPVKAFWRVLKKVIWEVMPLQLTCQFIFIITKALLTV
jgi:ubiquinone/menaquinone biosynthesis C-methylase UbiE